MRSSSAFILASVLVVAACAATPDYRPVADPDQPVVRAGFSVLPPGGERWVMPTRTPNDAAVFGKMDAEHARQRGSVVVSAIGVRAPLNDGASADSLLADLNAWIRGPEGDRITLVSDKLEPYRDEALGSDCVRVTLAYRERGNPNYPGEALAMPMWGKACRHPQAPGYFVVVAYSERRPVSAPALMTERLRAECERTVESLRFLPLPK